MWWFVVLGCDDGGGSPPAVDEHAARRGCTETIEYTFAGAPYETWTETWDEHGDEVASEIVTHDDLDARVTEVVTGTYEDHRLVERRSGAPDLPGEVILYGWADGRVVSIETDFQEDGIFDQVETVTWQGGLPLSGEIVTSDGTVLAWQETAWTRRLDAGWDASGEGESLLEGTRFTFERVADAALRPTSTVWEGFVDDVPYREELYLSGFHALDLAEVETRVFSREGYRWENTIHLTFDADDRMETLRQVTLVEEEGQELELFQIDGLATWDCP